jgi:hypothetical protein
MDDDLIAPIALGLEERGVCARDDGRKVLLVGCLDDPEAHREPGEACDDQRGFEPDAQCVEDSANLFARAGGERDDELLATVSTDEVLGTYRLAEDVGEEPERSVARFVSIGIVERFEVVVV